MSPEPAKPGPGQLPRYRGAGTGWHRRAQAVTIRGAGPMRHKHMGERAVWGFRGCRRSWLDCWSREQRVWGTMKGDGEEDRERDSSTWQGLLGSGPFTEQPENERHTPPKCYRWGHPAPGLESASLPPPGEMRAPRVGTDKGGAWHPVEGSDEVIYFKATSTA